eukprot:scaffold248350_cov41-Cyclotella_meneghiniana.AAC.2
MRHWDSPAAMYNETLTGKTFCSSNETFKQSSSNSLYVKVHPDTDSALFSWVQPDTDSALFSWVKTTELYTLLALTQNPVCGDPSGKAFQSRPHNTIQYIHNETLRQSSSNSLDVKVQPDTDSALFSSVITTELFTLVVQSVSDSALFSWVITTELFTLAVTQNPVCRDPCCLIIPIQTT